MRRLDLGFSTSSLSFSPDRLFVAVGGKEGTKPVVGRRSIFTQLLFSAVLASIMTCTAICIDSAFSHPLFCTRHTPSPPHAHYLVKICSRSGTSFSIFKNLEGRRSASAVTDIQWHPHEEKKDWIVTAPTNGKIILWNLKRDGNEKRGDDPSFLLWL
jgi:hypothetical protein